jgi:hypothetical protein
MKHKIQFIVTLLSTLVFSNFVFAQDTQQTGNVFFKDSFLSDNKEIINESKEQSSTVKYTLPNGKTINDQIIYKLTKNFGPKNVSVKILEATSVEGALVPTTDGNHRNNNSILPEIVKIENPEFYIEPGQSVPINLLISNTNNIPPGTYAGSVVLEFVNKDINSQINTENQNKGSGLTFRTRQAFSFLIDVPGVRKSEFTLTDITSSVNKRKVEYSQVFSNNGNTLLNIFGETIVTNSSGQEVYKYLIAPTLIPFKSNFQIRKQFESKSFYDTLTIATKITVEEYSPEKAAYIKLDQIEKKSTVNIFPTDELILASICLLIIILGICIIIIYKRIYLKSCSSYKVSDNDNVHTVAEKFKMHWKKLAKINKLKAPYILESGKTILVKKPDEKKSE